MNEGVACSQHGLQETTFVCQHLANSLVTRVPVGYNSAADAENEAHPDAWCNECEKRRREEGGKSGEWAENSNDYLDIKILCAKCYDDMRVLNA
jgi:hypothetical protein